MTGITAAPIYMEEQMSDSEQVETIEPDEPDAETLAAAEEFTDDDRAEPDTAALEGHASELFQVAVNSGQAGELYAALRAGHDAEIDAQTRELVIIEKGAEQ